MRPADGRYFASIDARLEEALAVAEAARGTGRDPSTSVEIPVAEDMADRVENLLGIDGVADRVRELEARMGREEAALELARDFADGRVGDYETPAETIEAAVRTAVALLTEGVVAAPIEGIDRVEVRPNDDGTEFVSVFYAGPIRSAGGTAQALSVLVADYTRALLGIDRYRPRATEVERYAEEVGLYDDETGLQYSPTEAEAKFIARHCPVMLDGEATGDAEVSGYRDLERVGTNRARGGMCLVLAEGIALKARKIQRYTAGLDEVDWPWLDDLIDGTYAAGRDGATDADEAPRPAEAADPDRPRLPASKKYLRDLIAGRPVFGHPSEPGAFRLRYGRARNHGLATAGVHPATMHLVDDFLATGTQLKTEHPGKAAGVVPVDSIEGPTVRLATGEVRRIDDPAEALELRNGVEAVLDLGEILVNYGEFVENNTPLAPAGYVLEWWVQDLAAAGVDVQALRDDPRTDLAEPSAAEALRWATEHDVPLHPSYTYCWHDVDVAGFEVLVDAVEAGRFAAADGAVATADEAGADRTLVLPRSTAVCDALEALLVEHTQGAETVTVPDALGLVRSLGFGADLERGWGSLSAESRSAPDALAAVNDVAPFTVRERAPTRIGSRMGRPEKSETRELSPAVHTLFPIGEAGGSQRDVAAAAAHADAMADDPGVVDVAIGRRRCPDCQTTTHRADCPDCGAHTEPAYRCPSCGTVPRAAESTPAECPRCGAETTAVERRPVDVGAEFRGALEALGERETGFEILKGVKGLTSATKTAEAMEKGVLRAKHGVSMFKDGTVRYDMTDLPVTAVRPRELGVTVERLRDLGYETDVEGEPLEYPDQLVDLRVQDVVLSEGAAEHMVRVADFVDDLLTEFYGIEAFYDVEDRDDLVGELVFGMAPHTSAAVVGRVVGFTDAAVGYAHPYFHAAKRRNCFHPETKVWFEDEAGHWHHSRIGRFVEERLEDPRGDDFGTAVQELDGDVFVPSIDEDGNAVRRRVEAVSRHPSTDHLVRIETRSGREITLTPDHELHVFDGATLTTKRASEMEPDDLIVKPRRIGGFDPGDRDPRIDLLERFLGVEEIDNDRLMIRGIGRDGLYDLFRETLADGWEGEFYPLKSTAEHLGLTTKGLSNYVYRDSVPAALLIDLLGSNEAVIEAVPIDVRLGVKHDRVGIDREIELNERVATLLGYYAAEGFARSQETPKGTIHQTTICGTEADARDFYVAVLREEFGVDPYRENEAKVTVSGRLTRAFFDTVLDAGVLAHEKRVPQCVFDAPDATVRAFLRGYFSGDGAVDSTALAVTATTVSRELKEDLLALLTRIGIVGQADRLEPVLLRDRFPDFYAEDDPSMSARRYVIKVTSEDAAEFAESVGFHLPRKAALMAAQTESIQARSRRVFDGGRGDYLVEPVTTAEYVESDTAHTYCLTVSGTHSLVANDLSNKQCDGDEDGIMLLMDGLLNFSKAFLPDKRGGRMDAPLVMSSRIDPAEIDDEAHNVDAVTGYSREFYEATRRLADPGSVDVDLAGDAIARGGPYAGLAHTHDTSDISLGPGLSAYKTLGSMTEKLDAQLALARKLRAVDETDVAERILQYHFLPDLLGNLRAFARQETRCLDCGYKYRRMPLSGDCRECGGDVNLTVHEGSVSKYLDTAIRIAEEFGVREYTKQRLYILQRSLESVFVNDHDKPTTIGDFM